MCLLLSAGVLAEKGDSLIRKRCTVKVVATPDSSLLVESGIVIGDTLVFEDFEEPDQVNTPTEDETGRNAAYNGKSITTLDSDPFPEWKIYPNPSSGKINVDIPFYDKQTKAVVRDQQGKVIQVLHGASTHVSYLSKGVYWIEVHLYNKREIKKLIVN